MVWSTPLLNNLYINLLIHRVGNSHMLQMNFPFFEIPIHISYSTVRLLCNTLNFQLVFYQIQKEELPNLVSCSSLPTDTKQIIPTSVFLSTGHNQWNSSKWPLQTKLPQFMLTMTRALLTPEFYPRIIYTTNRLYVRQRLVICDVTCNFQFLYIAI